MNALRWLEVLHAVTKDQLTSKEDSLVIIMHCIMINKGGRCVGTGDSWNGSSDISTELLPRGWNSNQDIYTLRYIVAPSSKYLMKIVKTNSTLLVNLLDANKSKAAGISVPTDDFVNEGFRSYSTAYKNLKNLEKNFEDNISRGVKLGVEASDGCCQKKSSGCSKNTPIEPDDPLLEERFTYPYVSTDPGVPSVGRSDLDPLGGFFGGGSGGGMLVDPGSFGRRPQRPDLGIGGPASLPRGAVPPGARFDPFGPPSRGGRGAPRTSFPDPDIIPPGFGDSFI